MISGALVFSSMLIVGGLYLLPPRAAPVVVQAVGPPAPAPAPPSRSAPEPARPGPPIAVTPLMQERGTENARLALEARRGEFVARCWAPAAAKQAEPGQIQLRFVLGFDPAGELIATGIVEDREHRRSDVTTCLRSIDLSFAIPAPGLVLQVEVPFTLP
jgi:hypothetical protein